MRPSMRVAVKKVHVHAGFLKGCMWVERDTGRATAAGAFVRDDPQVGGAAICATL